MFSILKFLNALGLVRKSGKYFWGVLLNTFEFKYRLKNYGVKTVSHHLTSLLKGNPKFPVLWLS